MNKFLTLIFCAAFLASAAVNKIQAQATPTKPAESQPTQSMQEQYDKLHGNNKKPAAQPSKTTTKPQTNTTKPQTAQKPAPAPSAPKASAEEDGFKFKVGLRGGANYCNYSVPSSQSGSGVALDPILGYHGGLILSFGGKAFSVQPEILYSQIGTKVKGSQGAITLTGETIVNTITVPVLFKYAIGSESFKFFVNAGGYGSYGLNGKAKTTLNQQTTKSDLKFEKGDPRIEYGAVGGAGIALGLGSSGAQLLIEGRYYYGLGNDDNSLESNEKALVRNIQGSVGILIPIGGK